MNLRDHLNSLVELLTNSLLFCIKLVNLIINLNLLKFYLLIYNFVLIRIMLLCTL